jgi:hypothetical protein
MIGGACPSVCAKSAQLIHLDTIYPQSALPASCVVPLQGRFDGRTYDANGRFER